MAVKRKAAALLLTLLVLMPLIPASVSADETIYYTAVNETVLELSDASMPFWSGGYLYVPSSIFSGKELGVYYSRNAAKRTVVLYNRNSSLIFNMDTKTLTDGSGNEYYPGPIEKNGVSFIPISIVAQFFGLTYTSTKITITTASKTVHGFLIRVKSGGAVLSDSAFTDAAATQLISRYELYSSQKETATTPTDESPVTPDDTTPVTEEPDTGREKLYLCFAVRDTDAVKSLLDGLDKAGMQATFYFPLEKLKSSGDLLRRMAATGQGIGFLTAVDPDGQWLEDLKEANSVLAQATGEKTRLILPVSASSSQLQAAKDAGWCALRANLNRSAKGLTTASAAAALLKKAEARKRDTVIWLDANVTAGGLKAFLTGATAAEDRCLAVTETVT